MFQQSINNALNSAVNIKGVQAIQDQTDIQTKDAKLREQTNKAKESLQTAIELKEAELSRRPDVYEATTEYYVDKIMQEDAEPSLVSSEIHNAAMRAARSSKWIKAYDQTKAREAMHHMASQRKARDEQTKTFESYLEFINMASQRKIPDGRTKSFESYLESINKYNKGGKK